MSDFKRLLKYIPYFESEDDEFCKLESGYPEYDGRLLEFINDSYGEDLLEGDYIRYLNENVKDHDFPALIPSADLELLKSILTYYVRQERFCDGVWAKAAKEKVFLRILYRLRDLAGQEGDEEIGPINN
jgi:hypothetical protein